ncbi:hypothetical protein L914_17996, partial [Phytophthora nicotianae]
KEYADRRGRKNTSRFRRDDRVLLSTDGIPSAAVTNLGANKLAPRFIGPFKVTQVIEDAYTLDIPKSMRLHQCLQIAQATHHHPTPLFRLRGEPLSRVCAPISSLRKLIGLPTHEAIQVDRQTLHCSTLLGSTRIIRIRKPAIDETRRRH